MQQDSTTTLVSDQPRRPQAREPLAQVVHGRAGSDAGLSLDVTAGGDSSNPYSSRQKRLAECPPKYRKLYRRAWGGKSRQAAIRTHCLECVGYSANEVALCTASACPLFEYRGGRL